jgi:hypothetical protein
MSDAAHGSPPAPRDPGFAIVQAANSGLANPDFRQSLRQMHEENYPLVSIVEALGLDDDMTTQIRAILESLDAEVVAGIRKATLEMLDSGDYVMPLDCNVTEPEVNAGVPVDVEVVEEAERQTIRVRRAETGDSVSS